MRDIFIIILANIVLYWRVVTYHLVVDDQEFYTKKFQTETHQHKFLARLKHSGTVWIPWADHLISLSLHTIASCLVYKLFGCNDVALMTALLFATNPVNMQGVAWLNGKRYVWNAIFVCLMFISPWFVVLYPLTAFFQIGAIFYPLMYIWTDCPYLALMIFTFGIIGGSFMWDWFKSRYMQVDGSPVSKFEWRKLVVAIKTVAYYAMRIIVPSRPLMWHGFLSYYGLTEKGYARELKMDTRFWCSLVFLCGLLVVGMIGGRPAGFGIMWYFLGIAPWSNIITVTAPTADRYCYLPSIGLLYAVVHTLYGLGVSPFGWWLVVAYSTVTSMTLFHYKNIRTFLDYHIHTEPCNYMPVMLTIGRGILHGEMGRTLGYVLTALEKFGDVSNILHVCSQFYFKIGDMKQSLDLINRAYECIPVGREDKQRPIFDSLKARILSNLKTIPKR